MSEVLKAQIEIEKSFKILSTSHPYLDRNSETVRVYIVAKLLKGENEKCTTTILKQPPKL